MSDDKVYFGEVLNVDHRRRGGVRIDGCVRIGNVEICGDTGRSPRRHYPHRHRGHRDFDPNDAARDMRQFESCIRQFGNSPGCYEYLDRARRKGGGYFHRNSFEPGDLDTQGLPKLEVKNEERVPGDLDAQLLAEAIKRQEVRTI